MLKDTGSNALHQDESISETAEFGASPEPQARWPGYNTARDHQADWGDEEEEPEVWQIQEDLEEYREEPRDGGYEHLGRMEDSASESWEQESRKDEIYGADEAPGEMSDPEDDNSWVDPSLARNPGEFRQDPEPTGELEDWVCGAPVVEHQDSTAKSFTHQSLKVDTSQDVNNPQLYIRSSVSTPRTEDLFMTVETDGESEYDSSEAGSCCDQEDIPGFGRDSDSDSDNEHYWESVNFIQEPGEPQDGPPIQEEQQEEDEPPEGHRDPRAAGAS